MGPLYLQIAESLKHQIEEKLGSNSALPSEEQLGKRFGVSRVTIRRALGLLERAGLISRQRGRGTIVNPPKVVRRLLAFTLEEDLRRQSVILETRALKYDPVVNPPEFIKQRLCLPEEGTAHLLSLVRLVDDRIIAHDYRYFALPIGVRFDPASISDRPVSAVLSELAGMPITGLDLQTEIIPSSRDIAKLLCIVPGVLVVTNTFTQYLENGLPIAAGVTSYRIDRVKFCFSTDDLKGIRRTGKPQGTARQSATILSARTSS